MRLGRHLDQTVFVLSTGRTATKAIAHYFDNCYTTVTARHEPAPSRVLRAVSHMYLARRIGPETVRRLLFLCRCPALSRLRGGTYLEANWYLHGCLDVLDQTFHNARVLHITRHPETYIRSMMNFSHYHPVKALFAPRLPYWILKPDVLPYCNLKMRDLSPREHYAWQWAAINSGLDRGSQLFGDRYLRVRYEDLFGEQARGLLGLADWMGLKPAPQLIEQAVTNKIHSSHDRSGSGVESTSGDAADILRHYCGKLMHKYGYESISTEASKPSA